MQFRGKIIANKIVSLDVVSVVPILCWTGRYTLLTHFGVQKCSRIRLWPGPASPQTLLE